MNARRILDDGGKGVKWIIPVDSSIGGVFNSHVPVPFRKQWRMLSQMLCLFLSLLSLHAANAQLQPGPPASETTNSSPPSAFAPMLEQAKAYWEKKDYQKAVSWYERALPLVERELGADNPQLVALLGALGNCHYSQGDYGRAVPLFQRILAIMKNSPTMKDRDSASMAALKGLGLCYLAQEDYRQAAPAFEGALAIEERVFPSDYTNLYATLALIAKSYHELKDYNRALHFYDRALSLAEKTLPAESAKMAQLLCTIGTIHLQKGDNDTALPFLERGLRIFDNQRGGTNDIESTTDYLLFARLEHTARLDQSLKAANELWLKHDAASGIPEYERLLGDVERAAGKESSLEGLLLFRVGFLFLTQGDFEKALPNLERSVKLIEPLPNNETNRLTKANLYWGLGLSYQALLKFDQAIRAYEQALEFKESLKGKEDPELVATLTAIAELHEIQGRPLQGIPLFQRALAINEKAFGSESPEAAQVLASLGHTWESAQNFDSAFSCLKRSLDICKKVFPSTNDAVASALGRLGSVYLDWGRYSEAIPLLERSVDLHEKNFVSKDTQLAFRLGVTLDRLGVAQLKSGNYEKGISTLQRSLTITETNFGAASINLVLPLNSMAVAFLAQGNFERALPLLERAVRIAENAPACKTWELVESINNLAALYDKAGDGDTALRLFNRSKEIAESQLGSQWVSVAYSLNGIALIAERHGDTAGALAAFERALAILEKNPGDPQGDAGGILNNMSELLESTGDTNRALAMLQRALAMQEKMLPAGDPHIAITLNNLAGRFSKRGNQLEAQRVYRRSLAITDAVYGKENPESCTLLENLAIVDVLGGDRAKGLGELVESARRWRLYVVGQITAGQSLGTPRIQEKTRSSRDWLHSSCGAARGELLEAAAASGAEQLVFGKALLEEVQAAGAQLAADGRIPVRELREQAVLIHERLDALAHFSDGAAWGRERAQWRDSERDRLEQGLKAIEEKVAATSELVALTVRERDSSLIDIVHSLPSKAVLVDFVQYRRTDFTGGENQWKEQRYAAYLTFPLAKGSTNLVVERVDLGEAAPINEAVEFICKRMSAGQYAARDLPPRLQRLSELVYAPLAKYLTNVSHLIVCPDGQLSRVPFEMLSPSSDFGATGRHKFLIEDKTISYVTSGREIVRLAASPKSNVQSPKSLVMGGPDFDLDLSKVGSASFQLAGAAGIPGRSSADAKQDALPLASRMPAQRALSRDYRGIKFPPLPGAEAEARIVAKLLGGDCVLRAGPEAREAELKAAVSPRVLHLATHGFFLSDQEFRRTNSLPFEWPGEWGQAGRLPYVQNDWENPLVRCGIALAGANHAGQITNAVEEDGLLTGLEASLLNLQGTELVILSACDSGTGEVKIGEGVMSLRRAFRIAGAQTVLASHWKVSDKATSQLMMEFVRLRERPRCRRLRR